MSRTYALQMLLQHGALTRKEIREITRWDSKTVDKTIEQLIEWGSVAKSADSRDALYFLP